MKSLLATLALTTALTLPGLAMARPVTLTTTLNDYGGDGAYLALYVTDASGAYVGSLWMAGTKSKYYEHLSDWYRATGGDPARNAIDDTCVRERRVGGQIVDFAQRHRVVFRNAGDHQILAEVGRVLEFFDAAVRMDAVHHPVYAVRLTRVGTGF